MDIQISYISVNKRGQPQRDQRRLEGPLISIGRGSHCQIHLPDPRISLLYANITVSSSGAALEAASGNINVNGRAVAGAILAVGDTIEAGPYVLAVETPPAGVPLALTVKLEAPLASFGEGHRLSLLTPRLSKRRLSYLGFVATLTLCLLIPLAPDLLGYSAATSVTAVPDSTEIIVRGLSAKFLPLLNPGPVSRSHQIFGADCTACHQNPFVQVRDDACIACHKTIREHIPVVELTGLKGQAFRDTRCAECHRDHKGLQMAPRSQALCAECHRDLTNVAAKAKSHKVTDFGATGVHPEFRLSLLDADKPDVIRRIRQSQPASAEMVERSNLKFNHKLHMDPAGVRDPEGRRDPAGMRNARGGRIVLKCSGCHQPSEGGRLMASISMERHCQSCHSLAFEPKVTTRQALHGDVEGIATMLREFYARLVLGDVPPDVNPPGDLPRLRPGVELTYPERLQALQIAEQKAKLILQELFDKRKVCSTCHIVSRTVDGVGWKVAPVRVAKVWMPQALFSHDKHKIEPCTKCHDMSASTRASQISMPRIAICHDCHAGATPVADKVTSDCSMCHKFHAGRDYWHGVAQAQTLPGGK